MQELELLAKSECQLPEAFAGLPCHGGLRLTVSSPCPLPLHKVSGNGSADGLIGFTGNIT